MIDAEPAPARGEAERERPSERARWLAAVAYLSFMSLFSLSRARRDPFIRYHASQGVLLFFAEIAFLAAALILEATVGRVPIAGLIIVGLFVFVAGITALALSAVGFVKSLFGEYWSLPFLGEWRERVPGLDWPRS